MPAAPVGYAPVVDELDALDDLAIQASFDDDPEDDAGEDTDEGWDDEAWDELDDPEEDDDDEW